MCISIETPIGVDRLQGMNPGRRVLDLVEPEAGPQVHVEEKVEHEFRQLQLRF